MPFFSATLLTVISNTPLVNAQEPAAANESLGGLFERSGAGGEFQVIDTSLKQMPRFGGRLGFNAARMAGTSRGYAETVNPETLRASWDSRLAEYYTKTYRVKRTTTLKA